MAVAATAPSIHEAARASNPEQRRPSYLFPLFWGLLGASVSARTAKRRGYDTQAYWVIGALSSLVWVPLLFITVLILSNSGAPASRMASTSAPASGATPAPSAPTVAGVATGNTANALMGLLGLDPTSAHVDSVKVALGGMQGGFKSVDAAADLGEYPGVQVVYDLNGVLHFADFNRIGDYHWVVDKQG